jgi:hypothetical protein
MREPPRELQEPLEISPKEPEIIAVHPVMTPEAEVYYSLHVDAKLNGISVLDNTSNAAANDRQLGMLDASLSGPVQNTLATTLGRLLGLGQNQIGLPSAAQRDLRVRLCMDDPLLSEIHLLAHKMYVAGKGVVELRSSGVTAMHLAEIGVTYDEWSACYGFGVKELVFLGVDWPTLCLLGFKPSCLTSDRCKSGPSVIAGPPLGVTFATLESTLGLTLDEAVFQLDFTTADFAILGETLESLEGKGFTDAHARHMGEPSSNYTIALAKKKPPAHPSRISRTRVAPAFEVL